MNALMRPIIAATRSMRLMDVRRTPVYPARFRGPALYALLAAGWFCFAAEAHARNLAGAGSRVVIDAKADAVSADSDFEALHGGTGDGSGAASTRGTIQFGSSGIETVPLGIERARVNTLSGGPLELAGLNASGSTATPLLDQSATSMETRSIISHSVMVRFPLNDNTDGRNGFDTDVFNSAMLADTAFAKGPGLGQYGVISGGWSGDVQLLKTGPGTTITGATASDALANNWYFEITLTPRTAMNLQAASVDWSRGGSSGVRGWFVRSSLDGFASDLHVNQTPDGTGTGLTTTTIELSSGFIHLTAPVTFRFYIHTDRTTRWMDFQNITFYSDADPVSIGNAGFRLMSAPRRGTILTELLDPIWTQGMTGADVEAGAANVWTFDDAAQDDWVAVSDLGGQSIGAGQGFLVYMFDDTDFNGTPDLPSAPAALSVSTAGTANTDDVTVSGIGLNQWHLAGNPFEIALDWDAFTKVDLTSTVYVYDSEGASWRDWNGSAGSLAGGVIAPYQGFFVQGTGAGGSLTMSMSDAAASAGTFYKPDERTGSLSLALSVQAASGDGEESHGVVLRDEAFVSFNAEGRPGRDMFDALKLMPFSVNERPLLLFEGGVEGGADAAETGGESEQVATAIPPAPTWSIANLPWSGQQLAEQGLDVSELILPLQAMHLKADPAEGNVPVAAAATLRWDAESLPAHVSVGLRDRRTDVLTPIEGRGEVAIETLEGSPIERVRGEGAPSYRTRDDAVFELVVRYEGSATSTEDGAGVPGSETPGAELPTVLALEQNYPNPFNPVTTITFGLPEATGQVSLRVYDLTGRLVASPLQGTALPAGWHRVAFDGSGLSSGVYTYVLRAGGTVQSRRFTLIK